MTGGGEERVNDMRVGMWPSWIKLRESTSEQLPCGSRVFWIIGVNPGRAHGSGSIRSEIQADSGRDTLLSRGNCTPDRTIIFRYRYQKDGRAGPGDSEGQERPQEASPTGKRGQRFCTFASQGASNLHFRVLGTVIGYALCFAGKHSIAGLSEGHACEDMFAWNNIGPTSRTR